MTVSNNLPISKMLTQIFKILLISLILNCSSTSQLSDGIYVNNEEILSSIQGIDSLLISHIDSNESNIKLIDLLKSLGNISDSLKKSFELKRWTKYFYKEDFYLLSNSAQNNILNYLKNNKYNYEILDQDERERYYSFDPIFEELILLKILYKNIHTNPDTLLVLSKMANPSAGESIYFKLRKKNGYYRILSEVGRSEH